MNWKKKIIGITIATLFIMFFSFYLYKNKDIFQNIKNIQLIYLGPIAALTILYLYINGLILKTLAIPFNIKLKEHFLLSISASFLNQVTPFRGGAGMRAIYMKKIYSLKYSHYISSLLGNYIIGLLVNSLLALIVLIILFNKTGLFNIYSFIIFFTLFIVTIIVTILDLKFKKENFITEKINSILKGWTIIKNHKAIIPVLILLTLINLTVFAFINYFTFLGLGQDIGLTKSFFFSVIQILVLFINITPGSLGITEGLYLIFGHTIAVSSGISLLVALTIRAVNVIILVTLGPLANYILYKQFKYKPIAE